MWKESHSDIRSNDGRQNCVVWGSVPIGYEVKDFKKVVVETGVSRIVWDSKGVRNTTLAIRLPEKT